MNGKTRNDSLFSEFKVIQPSNYAYDNKFDLGFGQL